MPVTLILVPHDTRWSPMMKPRTLLTGLALAGAVTAGVTATAVAQSDPSPTPTTTAAAPAAPSKDAADPAAKKARTDFSDQIRKKGGLLGDAPAAAGAVVPAGGVADAAAPAVPVMNEQIRRATTDLLVRRLNDFEDRANIVFDVEATKN